MVVKGGLNEAIGPPWTGPGLPRDATLLPPGLGRLLLLGDDTERRSKDEQWNGEPPGGPNGGTPTDKGPVVVVVDSDPRTLLSDAKVGGYDGGGGRSLVDRSITVSLKVIETGLAEYPESGDPKAV